MCGADCGDSGPRDMLKVSVCTSARVQHKVVWASWRMLYLLRSVRLLRGDWHIGLQWRGFAMVARAVRGEGGACAGGRVELRR